MAKRISRKVRALKQRLYRTMLARREDVNPDVRHRNCDEWVDILNADAAAAGTGVVVTNPMIRRCLVMLAEEGRVDKVGYGRHEYRAKTVADKLREREKDNKREACAELCAAMLSLGFKKAWASYSGADITISMADAVHMMNLITKHPRSAAEFFTPPPDPVDPQ